MLVKRYRGAVVPLLVLVVALFAIAPAALADSTTATLTGEVVDSGTSSPLPNVQVSTTDGSGNSAAGAVTDSSGHFTIPGLQPGDYMITFTPPSPWNSDFRYATLSAGQTDDLGTISLSGGTGTVTGHVTDGSGALPGMEIQLTAPNGATSTGFSDDTGAYTIANVPTGSNSVAVLDGAPDTFDQQTVQIGSVTVNGNTTATEDITVPAPPVPAGTVAMNSNRDLAWLNAERIANGLPGGIVLNPRWSTDCAAHDAYERDNGGMLTHYEAQGQPGYSDGGMWVGQTSILASDSGWAAGDNPFETAPIHLDQLYSPSLSVVGIDDNHGYQCTTTWAGMLSTYGADTVSTYPGDGVSGVPPSENAAEGPFVPGQFVGIPEGTTAGRELFVYLNQAGQMGQAQVQFVSASLSGPQGPVAIKTVDNTTPTVGPDLSGGIIIPVKPLAPFTTYTASVTLVNGSGTISHTWSFKTGANSSSGGSGGGASCLVPKLRHKTLAKARRALHHAGCQVGKVFKPKHHRRHHKLRVAWQSVAPGSRLTAGSKVSVLLI